MKPFNNFIYFFLKYLLDVPNICTTNMNSVIISVSLQKMNSQ